MLKGLKIPKKFAHEAVNVCCGSPGCAAGWPSSYQTASACVSALAEPVCKGRAFVHSWSDPVSTGILADLVSLFWGEFKLLFLAVEDFEISLCEGDSAVPSRTLLGWRTHALIRPLVHSHFQLSLEASSPFILWDVWSFLFQS